MRQKQIGAKLREMRGTRTVSEVARALGISQSTLSMYESGQRNPRDPIKERIAGYYGVSIGELFYALDFTKRE